MASWRCCRAILYRLRRSRFSSVGTTASISGRSSGRPSYYPISSIQVRCGSSRTCHQKWVDAKSEHTLSKATSISECQGSFILFVATKSLLDALRDEFFVGGFLFLVKFLPEELNVDDIACDDDLAPKAWSRYEH